MLSDLEKYWLKQILDVMDLTYLPNSSVLEVKNWHGESLAGSTG